MKDYKCYNLGNCDKADRGEIIKLGAGEQPACPECGKSLHAQASGKNSPAAGSGRAGTGIAILAGAGLLGLALLGGGGYFAWTMLASSGPDFCAMVGEERRLAMDELIKSGDASADDLRGHGDALVGCGGYAEALVFYRFALDKGDNQAAMAMGRIYDPIEADQNPVRLNIVSPEAAYSLYRRALSDPGLGGDAAEALQRLKLWVNERAAAGDAPAQALLQVWID